MFNIYIVVNHFLVVRRKKVMKKVSIFSILGRIHIKMKRIRNTAWTDPTNNFFYSNFCGRQVQIGWYLWNIYDIQIHPIGYLSNAHSYATDLKMKHFLRWKLSIFIHFILERFHMCLSKHLGSEEPGYTLIRLKWIQGTRRKKYEAGPDLNYLATGSFRYLKLKIWISV